MSSSVVPWSQSYVVVTRDPGHALVEAMCATLENWIRAYPEERGYMLSSLQAVDKALLAQTTHFIAFALDDWPYHESLVKRRRT